ncbi:MAG: hypothetical protein INR69_11335 [Mucilaginibacter polytrichastri]|nr:hypothetical protein [Mucilaginibacter polytrichastri]
MAYEKTPFTGDRPLTEFSRFVENVRFSQVIQEKIKDITRNLKVLDQAPIDRPETFTDKLKQIEEQMAELIRIRDRHFEQE